jgi:hypothetical protein
MVVVSGTRVNLRDICVYVVSHIMEDIVRLRMVRQIYIMVITIINTMTIIITTIITITSSQSSF